MAFLVPTKRQFPFEGWSLGYGGEKVFNEKVKKNISRKKLTQNEEDKKIRRQPARIR
jgi:hypothetical protein